MKRAATAITLFSLLALPVMASGPGGGGMSSPMPSMQSKSPHDQAVDFFNNAERRIDGLSQTHEARKAPQSAYPQRAAKLQARLNKAVETAAADLERAVKNDPQLFQAYSELG